MQRDCSPQTPRRQAEERKEFKMSAYVLPDSDLNALLSFAHAYGLQVQHNGVTYRCSEPETCQLLAVALRAENTNSVNVRYNENDQAVPITWRCLDSETPNPVEVAELTKHYDYNACETGEEYCETLPYAVTTTIRAAAALLLPGQQAIAKAQEQAGKDAERT